MSKLFFLLFILPISLINYMFWMVQNMLFLMSFVFIVYNNYSNYLVNLSYFMGRDLLSYSLILLSLWITSLMLMASEMVLKTNNYMKLFIFNVMILLLLLVLAFGNSYLFLFYYFMLCWFLHQC